MATGGHGVRFQYNYTHDQPGLPGVGHGQLAALAAPDPHRGHHHRLRLHQRHHLDQIGTAHLAGLPATVDVGLFATSPVSFQGSAGGVPTQATATFDHVSTQRPRRSTRWQGRSVGTGPSDFYPTLAAGSYHRSRRHLRRSAAPVTSPPPSPGGLGGNTASAAMLFGLIVALIVLIVVADACSSPPSTAAA